MRLVLVEHGGERVRGDSAAFAARSPEWAENTFRNIGVAKLSVIAARLFDESEGRFKWNYLYSSFGPLRPGDGYDIFACGHDLDILPSVHFQDITNVICECSYVGHVLCIPPVVSITSRRRPSTTAAPANGGARFRANGGR